MRSVTLGEQPFITSCTVSILSVLWFQCNALSQDFDKSLHSSNFALLSRQKKFSVFCTWGKPCSGVYTNQNPYPLHNAAIFSSLYVYLKTYWKYHLQVSAVHTEQMLIKFIFLIPWLFNHSYSVSILLRIKVIRRFATCHLPYSQHTAIVATLKNQLLWNIPNSEHPNMAMYN